METIEYLDVMTGRKYEAKQDGDLKIIVGPPEGLVDAMHLPEPFATTLHNILYRRRIFNYSDISKNPQNLTGALQEAMMLDTQMLSEAYFNYEKEAIHEPTK